jgi:hypothetical protein
LSDRWDLDGEFKPQFFNPTASYLQNCAVIVSGDTLILASNTG